jgi:hypothetical protein
LGAIQDPILVSKESLPDYFNVSAVRLLASPVHLLAYYRPAANYNEAVSNGLDGAPSIFLNGEMIGSVLSYDELVERVTTSLRKYLDFHFTALNTGRDSVTIFNRVLPAVAAMIGSRAWRYVRKRRWSPREGGA